MSYHFVYFNNFMRFNQNYIIKINIGDIMSDIAE